MNLLITPRTKGHVQRHGACTRIRWLWKYVPRTNGWEERVCRVQKQKRCKIQKTISREPECLLSREKGHLWLWREVSLNDKYDTMRNIIQFYFEFSVCTNKFDRQKHTILQFFGWHDHQICILKNTLILTANCIFYFTPTETTYIHIYMYIPRYMFDNNYNHEYIQLYSRCFEDNVKSFSKTVKELFTVMNNVYLADPAPPPSPRMLLWWMCKTSLLTKW